MNIITKNRNTKKECDYKNINMITKKTIRFTLQNRIRITKNEYDYKKSAAASRLTLPLGWDGRSRMITRMMVEDDDDDDDDDVVMMARIFLARSFMS